MPDEVEVLTAERDAALLEVDRLKVRLSEAGDRTDQAHAHADELTAAVTTIAAERDKTRAVLAAVRERCQGWVDLPDWHAVTTYQVAGRSILDLLDGEQLALEVPERWRPLIDADPLEDRLARVQRLIDADVAEQVAERKAAEVDLLAEVCDRLADQLRDALTVVRFLRGEL